MFSRLTLSNRLLLIAGGITALTLAAVVSVYSWQTATLTNKQALATAEEQANHLAHEVQLKLERSMVAAMQMRLVMEGWKKSGNTDRKIALGMLKEMLEGNVQMLGVYTGWEPNAFDGKDLEFASTEGHDATGRFIPYWNRGSGQPVLEPLLDYEKPGTGDYYLLPRSSGKTSIIAPYLYPIAGKDLLITSFVMPVKVDGKFAGITGVDLSLASLQEMLAPIRPYETGFVSLIANNGCYVSDRLAENANKDFGQDAEATEIKGRIAKGEKFALTQSLPGLGKTERFFVPIWIGDAETPWSLVLSIPLDRLLAESRQTLVVGISTALIGFAISMICLALALRSVTRRLTSFATLLDSSSDQVALASAQTSSSSQSLAEGASEQAASLEETSASLEEMASMTRRSAENAQSAKELANQARTAADAGASDVAQMDSAMLEIKQASDNIAKIIKTIDEIAFQTNILALNAAVEAARAGEAGMGFAVVADEVRSLAQRSAQAAKETAEKIEDCIRKSEAGVTISSKVGASLNEILSKATQVDELVAEIATASREQSQGIDQVNTALTQMDKVTQNNAASAEESASAAEELNAQAQALKNAVSDLQALVGGSSAAAASNDEEPRQLYKAHPIYSHSASAHGQPVVSPKQNGTHSQNGSHGTNSSIKGYKTNGKNGSHGTNGNGKRLHSHSAASPAHNRNVIPLEDEFQDF